MTQLDSDLNRLIDMALHGEEGPLTLNRLNDMLLFAKMDPVYYHTAMSNLKEKIRKLCNMVDCKFDGEELAIVLQTSDRRGVACVYNMRTSRVTLG